MTQPKALILQATGTNRDADAAYAIEAAGGIPVILHINQLRDNPRHLCEHQMLVLPGGFSYGDALGAGRLWATDMRWLFQEALADFVASGKPVIGICNGFQALVKSGWLPGPPNGGAQATLTRNLSNHFECRWVWLAPHADSPCVFTQGLIEPITCPVAHGEGRFITQSDQILNALRANGQIALTYIRADGGSPAYPDNPNGSIADIAGICNKQGNVFGLMPHPEDHVLDTQGPSGRECRPMSLGLTLFQKGLAYAAQV